MWNIMHCNNNKIEKEGIKLLYYPPTTTLVIWACFVTLFNNKKVVFFTSLMIQIQCSITKEFLNVLYYYDGIWHECRSDYIYSFIFSDQFPFPFKNWKGGLSLKMTVHFRDKVLICCTDDQMRWRMMIISLVKKIK